jgi:hypothetical protein
VRFFFDNAKSNAEALQLESQRQAHRSGAGNQHFGVIVHRAISSGLRGTNNPALNGG